MRSTVLVIPAILASSAVSACMAAEDPRSGFTLPDVPVSSYDLQGDEVAAEWSCLGSPTSEVPTSVEIQLTGAVFELGTFDAVAGVEVGGFAGTAWDAHFAVDTTDENGAYALSVPAGTRGFGMRVAGVDRLTGYRLDVGLETNVTEQEVDLDSVTLADASAIAASVGMQRSPGRGLVLGGIRDCDDQAVGGAIATVSTTSGTPTHADRVSSYYFDPSALPTTPNDQPYTSSLGMFLIVELPPSSAPHWLQVWGFVDDAALQAGELTLLAERPIPMVADSAVSIGLAPLRTE